MARTVDHDSPEPPYEQVRQQIATGVISGDLAPGHRLPTVRALADELGLAVNTIARAYRELEADGVVATRGRKGTFVTSTRIPDAESVRAVAAFVTSARRQGLSLAEATRLVEEHWPIRAS